MKAATRTLILPLCAAVLLWGGASWNAGFSLDDREILFGNPVVEGELPWSAVFDRDYWHHQAAAGHWRPLAVASLRLERALFGGWAGGYHLASTLLHALVVALAWRTGERLWPRAARLSARGRDPLLAGLLVFALHPALADSVAWISGRTSSLSAAGGLAGALTLACLARPQPPQPGAGAAGAPRSARSCAAGAASFAGLALALMGKEDGLVFAPLYLAIALAASRRRALAVTIGCCLAIGAWLLARQAALGHALPAAPYALLAEAELGERLAIGVAAAARLTRLALLPLPHSPTASLEALRASAPPTALALGALACSLAVVLGALALAWRARARQPCGPTIPALSLVGIALAWLPHAQLIPSGELFAPRFLYLPLLFGLPLIGSLCARLPLGICVLLLGAAAPLAWQQAAIYQSRGAYWTRVLQHEEGDARAQVALGNARLEAGEGEAARAHFERALELRPRYARAWVNLGTLHLSAQRHLEAEECLQRAAALQPTSAKAWGNLGVLYLRERMFEEAHQAYQRACAAAPGMSSLWRGLGRALAELSQPEEARRAFERALALDPADHASRSALRALKVTPPGEPSGEPSGTPAAGPAQPPASEPGRDL